MCFGVVSGILKTELTGFKTVQTVTFCRDSHSQTQISHRNGNENPHWNLHPNHKAGFKWVAVISDVEFRHYPAQVLLKMKTGRRENIVGKQ